jgi:uncharacterized protein
MKADPTQQRALLELAELDAELNRLAHRATNLAEQHRFEQAQTDHRAATDRLAVLGIAIEDLDAQVVRFESEIDGVRRREDRDRALLASSSTGAKQLGELQHELETLQRRQSSLEDSLLEIMERREQLQQQHGAELAAIKGLDGELAAARQERDTALAEIEHARGDRLNRRAELLAAIDEDLASLYDRVGAGLLRAGRCGACRIEIVRGELSRITGAAADDVVRCPDCNAILLREKVTGA